MTIPQIVVDCTNHHQNCLIVGCACDLMITRVVAFAFYALMEPERLNLVLVQQ